MGHKVNPISFRLGKLQSWKSKWFARKNFAFLLEEDIKLRDFIEKKLKSAGISRVEILRSSNKATFVIKSSRPGVVIGREGAGIEELRKILKKKMQDPKIEVKLDIEEVRTPWLDASLVAQNLPLINAAAVGVYWHGLAGDIALKKVGDLPLTANDLLNNLATAYLQIVK